MFKIMKGLNKSRQDGQPMAEDTELGKKMLADK